MEKSTNKTREEFEQAAREQVEELLEQTRSMQVKGAASVKRSAMRSKRSLKSRILRTCLNGVFWAMVLVLIVILSASIRSKQRGEIPTVFGYSLFQVETGSMVPTLPIGSYILTKTPQDASALEEGQIVTFQFINGTVVTHRIIEVLSSENGEVQYRTKGDNPLNDPDPELLTPDRVLREYVFTITLPNLWGD